MKEHEENRMLAHLEIAARLLRLADEVEKGSLTIGQQKLPMPDQAEFELEVERDESEIKIEWQ